MKSKSFLAHLNKAITSGQFKLDGKEGYKVLSIEGNTLKCEHDGKEFDFCVESIKACKASAGACFDLLSGSVEKQETKKKSKTKSKKEDELKKEDKE